MRPCGPISIPSPSDSSSHSSMSLPMRPSEPQVRTMNLTKINSPRVPQRVSPSSSMTPLPSRVALANVEDFEADKNKAEKELEAERLWWSEASERQVKELESSFMVEFQRTADRLRSDMSACQDRLEMLVEAEKKQRHASIADLKRELDIQQVTLSEMAKRPVERSIGATGSKSLPLGTSQDLQGIHEIMAKLRCDLDSSVAQHTSKDASMRATVEQQKTQTEAAEAMMTDLRRELRNTQEQNQLRVSQIEVMADEVRRDMRAIQEKADLQAQSNSEVHTLHQVIMQSAGDLGRGIEDVSAAVMATEHKLRQELGDLRRVLENADTNQRMELTEALNRSAKQLSQGLADECEKRVLEANVLKARLEATSGQVEDMQSTMKLLKTTQGKSAQNERSEDVRSVRALAESVRLHADGIVEVLSERVGRLEASVDQNIRDSLAEERSFRISGLSEIQARLDASVESMRQVASETARTAIREADTSGCASSAADRCPSGTPLDHATMSIRGSEKESANGSLPMSDQVLQELRTEISTLKANLQIVDAECRRCSSTTSRIEADTQNLEAESRAVAAMAPRVEALEERCRKTATAVMRVEALEEEVKQAAKEVEIRRLDVEVRRVVHETAPVASRLDCLESEVRKAARDSLPLTARIDSIEAEMQRMLRDSAPMSAGVEAVRAEIEAVKARLTSAYRMPCEGPCRTPLIATPTTAASLPTQCDTPSTDLSISRRTFQNRVAQPQTPVASQARGPEVNVASASRARSMSRTRASPIRGASPTQVTAASTTPAVPVPMLSDDLKQSISNLVNKVNITLSAKLPEKTQQSDVQAQDYALSKMSGTSFAQGKCAAGTLDSPSAQDGLMQALQAVQQLREKNLSLREENAELVEELLAHDNNLLTPAGSVQYNVQASAAQSGLQSACATPGQQSQTAQLSTNFVQPVVQVPHGRVGSTQVPVVQRSVASSEWSRGATAAAAAPPMVRNVLGSGGSTATQSTTASYRNVTAASATKPSMTRRL